MTTIVPIVEGDGEIEAVPILVRSLLHRMGIFDWKVAKPKNTHGCGNLFKRLEDFLKYAAKEGEIGGILVLVDSDERCPRDMAIELAKRATDLGLPSIVAFVVACREYEAWFIASLEAIAGNRGLPDNLRFDGDVEEIRNPKKWLSDYMPDGRIYKETTDQAALTSLIDIDLAMQSSRSFRRMVKAIEEITTSNRMDRQRRGIVTPGIPG